MLPRAMALNLLLQWRQQLPPRALLFPSWLCSAMGCYGLLWVAMVLLNMSQTHFVSTACFPVLWHSIYCLGGSRPVLFLFWGGLFVCLYLSERLIPSCQATQNHSNAVFYLSHTRHLPLTTRLGYSTSMLSPG